MADKNRLLAEGKEAPSTSAHHTFSCEGHGSNGSGGRPGFPRDHQSVGPQLRDSAGLHPHSADAAGGTGFAISARSIRETGT